MLTIVVITPMALGMLSPSALERCIWYRIVDSPVSSLPMLRLFCKSFCPVIDGLYANSSSEVELVGINDKAV